MADQKQSRLGGWFKAIIGTLTGLASGAAMMYVSPLVDSVIKPPKPLANFAVETDGLTVTFHNRYAGQGWWDFGDGSPLEPAMPDQSSISHTYPKPGTYPAKLIVRNFIGDEHERSVTVDVTVNKVVTSIPTIAALDAHPMSADRSAPATFRITAQAANADHCIWDFGPERPPEVVTDSCTKLERTVTFATPGEHLIQLTAMNGGQAVKRSVKVRVEPPAAGMFVARLKVTGTGMQADRRVSNESVPVAMGRATRGSVKIDRQLDARAGFTILKAEVGPVDPSFRDVKATVAANGKSVRITGEYTASSNQSSIPPMIPVQVTQERHVKSMAAPADVMASLGLPGSAVLPLPPLAANEQRNMVLELRGANGATVWQQPLPARSLIEYQNRRYTIQAAAAGNQVRVDVTPVTTTLTSFEK